ncbi:MAG: hypothetical protein A3I88_01835 [Candidatus Portnoybacteria bacterium RIFCSPLOWO2_12_FULL_39_9]|uniref:DUF86 domain-containing protein n=1 Tax=Candidatus Portnoybacteria bacterium RIFCSPHIGHO2_12_FULL_38_9 TaxID=1801997 RepID=A0A1G2FH98_9BACT|nr:MAG: hypothetical protein A3H00_03080 [Candidatus Portnoybacteria bacterium RBG_13_40_8]OGZ36555.1 MAG: hypothetical protein A2646_00015 [Candidatus Portnoybacteria bacterium RIFCSPHIGHO2_02_FULL_39_12]OGZ37449.1 MAG: hypothetical protein A3J64_00440 [Candidatus Portnoybacteria bacterium RIFCSPHIGHO2_12_FULL_38_9]OGZ39095.1 MAG: hypothetical protein A3F21_00015 [Candidatus Portnoybacteria bacterium RIFCSPLOWO2_01_FULL_38_39]OGZ40185.1 MAG: hypothetical protein A3I88_01835 [Candidatus Portnoy
MNKIDINKKLIIDRIDIIQKSVERLKKMRKMSQGKFALEDNFAIAEHNLRRALEAVFDIGSHILSRIPHVQVSAYKEIAQKLGEYKIISKKFAENNLTEMAGYRNRLTHFYFDVTPLEMYKIVKKDLGDFDTFLNYIKVFLSHHSKRK